MRAYHRVDPLMDERKGEYTPAQFGAYLKVQLMAGRQTDRGWFRSVTALKSMLPSAYARHVDFLVSEGDLIEKDGRLYVDGWQEWQEGDLTVRDRMAALRNRRRNGTVTPTVTEPSPPATRSSVGVGVGISESHDSSDAREVGWLRAWLMVRHKDPSPAQRMVIDKYLRVFEVTGPDRAERTILSHPNDPIGALKDDMAAALEERRAEVMAQEAESTTRKVQKTEPWQAEFRAAVEQQYRDLETA